MARHLAPLVVCQRLAQRRGDLVQLGGEAGQRRFGRCVRHARQQYQARCALHQHTHTGLVASPLDQVALPVTGHKPISDLGRAHVDADHLGNLAAPVLARRARPTGTAALAQAGQQDLTQLALGMRVDGVVDRLVRDVQFGVLGPHALECPRDLLGRPIPAQHVGYQWPQRPIGIELGRRACCSASRHTGRLCRLPCVAAIVLVAPQFTAQARRAASQAPADESHAPSLLFQRLQHHPLFRLQLLESSRHLHTLPHGPGVAFQI
ncbi:hypothetical protein ACAN107058_13610 [Paracidovorax anthurii]